MTVIRTKERRSLLHYELVHWLFALFLAIATYCLADALGLRADDAFTYIGIGAFAGYLTNEIAVTLLTWPTRPLLKGRFLGLLYQRREAFGAGLIKNAVQTFLSPDFFKSLIADKKVEDVIDRMIVSASQNLYEKPLGNFTQLLGKTLNKPVDLKKLEDEFVEFVEDLVFSISLKAEKKSAHDKRLRWLFFTNLIDGLTKHQKFDHFASLIVAFVLSPKGEDLVAETYHLLYEKAADTDSTLGDFIEKDLQKQMAGTFETYLRNFAVSELKRRLSDPAYRKRLTEFIKNETQFLMNQRVAAMTGFKGWLVRTFGNNDLNQAADDIPERILGFCEGLLQSGSQSSVWKIYSEVFGRYADLFWELKLKDIASWLPIETRSAFLKHVFSALRQPKNTAAVSRGLSHLLEKLSHTLVSPDSTISSSQALKDTDASLKGRSNSSLNILLRAVAKMFWSLDLPSLKSLFGQKSLMDLKIFTAFKDLVFSRITTVLPGLAQYFPVEEKLLQLWQNMSNAQIKETIDDALGSEFKGLVNAGISLGSIIAAVIYFSQNLFLTDFGMVPPVFVMPIFLTLLYVVVKSIKTNLR